MPYEHLHRRICLRPGPFPEPYAPVEASIGKQAPIGTPRQGMHRAAMSDERLQVRTGFRIPEPNGGIISAAGERASIGGKGQTMNVIVRMPVRPEQRAALAIPQLDGAIPTPGGESAFVWAESQRPHRAAMRLPGQMQDLPLLAPHLHLSLPTPHGPVPTSATDGYCPGRIKCPAKDGVTQGRPGKVRILHLDPLQERSANDELRQV